MVGRLVFEGWRCQSLCLYLPHTLKKRKNQTNFQNDQRSLFVDGINSLSMNDFVCAYPHNVWGSSMCQGSTSSWRSSSRSGDSTDTSKLQPGAGIKHCRAPQPQQTPTLQWHTGEKKNIFHTNCCRIMTLYFIFLASATLSITVVHILVKLACTCRDVCTDKMQTCANA